MANQSHELNSAARERAAGNRAPTIANLPAVIPPSTLAPRSAPSTPPSTHQCPNCGAWAPTGSSVCAECGGRIQPKPQKIRCRLCGTHASATLVICPDCGRELHPAPSRVLSWGAPTILVVLFLLVMVQRWESGNPLRWIQTQVATSRAWVSQVAARLDPQIEISTLPEAVTERGQVTEVTNDSSSSTTGLQSDTAFDTPSGTVETTLIANPNVLTAPEPLPPSTQTDSASPEGAGQQDNSSANGTNSTLAGSITDSVAVTPTATATALPSPQPTNTAVAPSPTATMQPTVQATPTAIVDATATPRQTSTSAIVQTVPKKDADEVVAADLNARKAATTTVTILQPTPTTVPTQTATPTQTAVPTQAAVTYAIRAGDTPFGIATQFDISVDELLATNGLSLNDARRLRVGQVLTIVARVAAPVAEQPTATPTATATIQSTTANAALPAADAPPVTAAKSTVRVDAPVQRSPENGSFLSCGANNTVTWLPVAYIRESDQYLLHLGFLSGYNGDGSEQVTWILEQWRPSNVTQWDLDTGLCGLAPTAFN